MYYDKIPTYEELKLIKEEYSFSIFYPLFGGLFRIKLNVNEEKNIAIDYLEGGYLTSINYDFKSNYEFNHLYKFNKKNYDGLIKLYKEMLIALKKEVEICLERQV